MASQLKISERDTNQRALGCISFSVLAHFGLLGVLLFTPSMQTDIEGMAKGGGTSTSQNMKVDMSSAPAAPSREVILADAKDESAVTMPKAEAPPKVEEKVIARVLPQPKPKLAKKAAQENKPTKKPVAVAKPVLTEEKEDAPYQPESIADADPNDKSLEPEALSPVITDNPPEEESSDAATTSATAPVEKEVEKPVEREVAPVAPPKAAQTAGPAAAPAQAAQAPAPTKGEGTGKGDGNGPSQGPQSGGMAAVGAGTSPTSEQIVDSSLRNPLPGNPLPAYPQQDQLVGRQGTTVVVGRVNPNGLVSDVTVEKSSGSQLMDRAAVSTFKNWKFAKGPEALVRKGFAYQLKGEAKVMGAKLGGR